MNILNLTQHNLTTDQYLAGAFEPMSEKENIKELLTFFDDDMDDASAVIAERSRELALLADFEMTNMGLCFEEKFALIGGAPFLMAPLERELKKLGIEPLYAFSERESVEKIINGKTVKTSVFSFKRWIPAS